MKICTGYNTRHSQKQLLSMKNPLRGVKSTPQCSGYLLI